MSTSEFDPAIQLVDSIIAKATEREFEVIRDPKELSMRQTKSAHIEHRFGLAAEKETSERLALQSVLPPVGLLVSSHSNYAIQVAQFGTELERGEWTEDYYQSQLNAWRGYQQYAAIARTWLQSDFSDDLNLFLVGPKGSSDEVEWQNFAQVIERNDLVCRKLVWLPSVNHDLWRDELSEFLDRTFLAEPWKVSEGNTLVQLDSLSDSVSDTLSMIDKWRQVIDRPEFRAATIDHDAFVKALLELDE